MSAFGNPCYNCFVPLAGDVCPRCGFDNAAYMSDARPHRLRPLTHLNGRYLVGRALGEGGFGITYSGFDTTLSCRVAIKEYFPAGAVGRDPATGFVSCSASDAQKLSFEAGLEKCINEAQSLAKLDDIDSVVRIRDYFRANGTAYIIMDFVDGMTLGEYVKRMAAKPSFKEAYDLVRPVMTALDRMHARGFIHRDVSPDNIMVTPDGKVTLLDFGAVKTVSEGGAATEHPVIKRGFSPNEMYSTYGKMGAWTDVYSVCATIYYLITGRRPDEPADRLEDDRIFDSLPADVPAPAREVLKKGLSVKQTERYQTMGECIAAFDNALIEKTMPLSDHGHGSGRRSVPKPVPGPELVTDPLPDPKPKPRLKVIVIAAAALLILGGIAVVIAGSVSRSRNRRPNSYSSTTQAAATTAATTAEITTAAPKNNYMKSFADASTGVKDPVFGNSKYERWYIGRIIFEDSLDAVPSSGSWDVSRSSDRSVVAYITEDSNVEYAPNVLHIAADGYIIAPVDCSHLFLFGRVVEIDFNGIFLTPYTTNMYGMFSTTECDYYDLSSFDTSRVTDMRFMFSSTDFVSINYGPGFDTSNVTDMSCMFYDCSASEIDVSCFNTAKVERMVDMFESCDNLKQIDISNFRTTSLKDAEDMFKNTDCTVTYSGTKFWS